MNAVFSLAILVCAAGTEPQFVVPQSRGIAPPAPQVEARFATDETFATVTTPALAGPQPSLAPPFGALIGTAPGVGFEPIIEPGVPAFTRVPSPVIIPLAPGDLGEDLIVPPVYMGAVRAEFEDAAHFPWPAFDMDEMMLARDALIIYEGMAVVVGPDGRYWVRFVAEVPEMPAVLRLQYRVVDTATLQAGTVTLPPIKFELPHDSREHHPSHSYFVYHEGYSPALQRVVCAPDKQRYRIERGGVVRFGSIPEPARFGADCEDLGCK